MTLGQMLRTTTALDSPSEQVPASLEPVADVGVNVPRRSGKATSQAKWECLNGVLADVAAHRLAQAAFTVAFVIVQHINARSGDAWPSQKRMMRMTGLSETTLRVHLKALIDCGHIEQLKRGVRNGNKYRLRRAAEEADRD
ncbi:helix-turn-helix domain-containing protein [Methylobacterium fujisawaense]|uniref:helix-turn-helix domain-containing protein n=1 Tax=Methylobacterium fujisawaense TaxID=107400 RepID=UPI002449EA8C|nr:helix-turn-helix domain-containing protein [Methylobacterium fujisawaense]MDH3031072.1 helix-turn-helix domain-containing protein [Methylobacterium fujisawaense]